MDLSQLSTADLTHLQAGNIGQVSTQGLQYLHDGTTPQYHGSGQSVQAIGNNQTAPTGSPQAQAANSPVSGNSFLQNAAIGSGKMFTDIGLGAGQILGTASRQDAANKNALDAPIMNTAGGRLGQIGTGAALGLLTPAVGGYLGIAGAESYAGAAATGAIFGGLSPISNDDSRLGNMAQGAALGVAGQYGGNVLSRWLTSRAASGAASEAGSSASSASGAQAGVSISGSLPANQFSSAASFGPGAIGTDASAGLTASQSQIALAGEGLGMRLTPGQQSGSVALRQFEAKLSSQPWSSGPFNAISKGNQEALNQTWTRAIGEGGTSADATVLQSALERTGQVFQNTRDPTKMVLTSPETVTNALDKVDNDFLGLLPNNGSIRDNPLVSRYEALAGSGSINGEQLGDLSSKLGRAAGNQMTSANGDRQLGQALYAVKDHVDDQVASTLSGPELAEYNNARSQYRALMQLTGRVGNVNPSTGEVSGRNMANYLQQTDKRGFLFGQNQSDAYNAARFAQAFKPVVGDSGTATRQWNPVALAVGIPANIAARAYLSTAGSATARAAVAAHTLIAPPVAVGKFAAPFFRAGLPGAVASLPYLTQ